MNKTECRKIILDFLIDWRDNFSNYKSPLCSALDQYRSCKQVDRYKGTKAELLELFALAGLDTRYPFNESGEEYSAELISREGHLIYSNPKRIAWVNDMIAVLKLELSINFYEGME